MAVRAVCARAVSQVVRFLFSFCFLLFFFSPSHRFSVKPCDLFSIFRFVVFDCVLLVVVALHVWHFCGLSCPCLPPRFVKSNCTFRLGAVNVGEKLLTLFVDLGFGNCVTLFKSAL